MQEAEHEKVQLVIQFDPVTGEIAYSFPNNTVLALGLLEYAHETVLFRLVRPQMVTRIVPFAGPLPPKPS